MALKQLLICTADDEVLFSGVSQQDPKAVRYDVDFEAPGAMEDDDRAPTLVPPPLAAGAPETLPAPAPIASVEDESFEEDDDSPTLLPPRISGTFPVGFALKDAALRFGLGSLDESPVIVEACANEPRGGTR